LTVAHHRRPTCRAALSANASVQITSACTMRAIAPASRIRKTGMRTSKTNATARTMRLNHPQKIVLAATRDAPPSARFPAVTARPVHVHPDSSAPKTAATVNYALSAAGAAGKAATCTHADAAMSHWPPGRATATVKYASNAKGAVKASSAQGARAAAVKRFWTVISIVPIAMVTAANAPGSDVRSAAGAIIRTAPNTRAYAVTRF